MQLSDFLYQLDELLELSKLPPNSCKFDRQADCLIRTNYDLDSLDFPEKAHWERIQIIWSIVGCALFVLYLVGLLLYAKYTQKTASDLAFWLIMLGFLICYLPLGYAIYASFKLRHFRQKYTRGKLREFGTWLQALTPEQFETIDLLIHEQPPCNWGEAVRPGDVYGCCYCGCTFPIGENDWEENKLPCCPECGSSSRLILTIPAEIHATKEDLLLMHDLFIEE